MWPRWAWWCGRHPQSPRLACSADMFLMDHLSSSQNFSSDFFPLVIPANIFLFSLSLSTELLIRSKTAWFESHLLPQLTCPLLEVLINSETSQCQKGGGEKEILTRQLDVWRPAREPELFHGGGDQSQAFVCNHSYILLVLGIKFYLNKSMKLLPFCAKFLNDY